MSTIYQWLHDEQVFSGLVGTMLVAIAVPLTAWLSARINASRSQTSFTLRINIPEELKHMRFVVRHVRDGASSWQGGSAYKEDKPFPPPGKDDLQTSQKLVFPRHVGILFKVYVIYDGRSFDDTRGILEKAGYINISRGTPPHENWAWFILPNYTSVTHGTITDNFYLD